MLNDVLTEVARREAERLGMGDVRVMAVLGRTDWGRRRELGVRMWWPDERQTNQYIRTSWRDDRNMEQAKMRRAVCDMVAGLRDWYADKGWEQA